jgi:hypothetical protein
MVRRWVQGRALPFDELLRADLLYRMSDRRHISLAVVNPVHRRVKAFEIAA